DLLEAELPEDLPEAGQLRRQALAHHRDRPVARRDTRPAGGDDAVDVLAVEPPVEHRRELARLVGQERPLGNDMPGGLEERDDPVTAGVRLRRPAVAEGDDAAARDD